MGISVSELAAEYRLNAVEHGAATARGDHRRANRHHDRLIAAAHSLRACGADGDGAILALLTDAHPAVRGWAATHSLRIDEARSRDALISLAAEPGVVGFNARVVLSEWDKGRLKTP